MNAAQPGTSLLFEPQREPRTQAGLLRRVRYSWRWGYLLLILSAAAVYPALVWNAGAVAYDAARVHIPRALVFAGVLREGVLFPRWAQFFHYGLGSPIFTFYPALPYYIMAGLALVGIPEPVGWRILMAGGLLAASGGASLLVWEITRRRWPAVLAGIVFLYSPFVIRNSLERGSNEAYAMFLYPWILWSLLWLARRPGKARFLIATLLWAACIACHVLEPLILAPVALLAALGAGWRYRTTTPLLALLVGGLLTAFIWAPMFYEQRWVHIERDFQASYALPAQNPIPVDRLLALPALYDIQRANNDTGDRVGLLQMACLLLALPGAAIAWRSGRRDWAIILLLAGALGWALFWLFTPGADAVWRILAPVLDRLQYRMRLMGLQALAAAVAAGILAALVPRRIQPGASLLAACVIIAVVTPSLYINLRYSYGSFGNRLTLADVRNIEFRLEDVALTAFGEFVPRWRDPALDEKLPEQLGAEFDAQRQPFAGAPAGVRVTDAQVGSDRWDLQIEAPEPSQLALHLLYYPRWQASVDGRPVQIEPQPGTGYVQLNVPAGQHSVSLRYGSAMAEQVGFAAAGLCALGLLALLVWPARNLPWHKGLRPGQDEATTGHGQAEPLPGTLLLCGITALLLFKVGYVDGATTWLRCVSTVGKVCGAQRTTNVAFPGGLRLRGYTVATPQVRPGGEMRVSLYWQVDRPMTDGRYNFLSLRNADRDQGTNPATNDGVWLTAQHEGPGGFFNTAYVPGRIYEDEYRVTVPANIPPGKYVLETGWLDVANGNAVPPDADTGYSPLSRSDRGVLLPGIEIR